MTAKRDVDDMARFEKNVRKFTVGESITAQGDVEEFDPWIFVL
jgi:hypothetical protein